MAGVGARTAAKKASPAKAAPKGRTAVADEEPDLLADLTDEKPAARADDSEEVIDLLDGLTEDNGIPWIPDDEDDPSPAGIQGKVTFRGTVASDYGPAEVPLIELTAADGTVWSIRGYARRSGTRLRRPILRLVISWQRSISVSRRARVTGNTRITRWSPGPSDRARSRLCRDGRIPQARPLHRPSVPAQPKRTLPQSSHRLGSRSAKGR
jgi:hypothetical protein